MGKSQWRAREDGGQQPSIDNHLERTPGRVPHETVQEAKRFRRQVDSELRMSGPAVAEELNSAELDF